MARWISQENREGLRNPWVLGWLGGLILVVLINAVFIMTAIRTSPGLVEANYYEKGRDHERTVQQKVESRARLNWGMTIEIIKAPVQGEETVVSFYLKDRQGAPFLADGVELKGYRPSNATLDFILPMKAVSNGQYLAKLTFPERGVWELTAVVTQGGEQLDVTQRLTVHPVAH